MATQSEPSIKGEVYKATKEGFAELLADANRFAATHSLVTVVRLDKALAAVYERKPEKHPGSLF